MRIVEVSHWQRIGEATGARRPHVCRGRAVSAPGAFAPARRQRASSPDRTDRVRIVEVRIVATGDESSRPQAHEDRASAEVWRYQRRALLRRRGGSASSPDRTDHMRIVEVSHWHRFGHTTGARGPGLCRGRAISALGAFAPARRRQLEFPAH
jgi:hypothetical protein